MHIIIGNYGNHSLAVLQTLIEQKIQNLHFIYVDTGWCEPDWVERVKTAENYARQHGISTHSLKSIASFQNMVLDRKQFPSPKFQWCAGFLKGLAVLKRLEDIDPFCEAVIISGKRLCDLKLPGNLQEYMENVEFYNGRSLWHPLWTCDENNFKDLIARTGFDLLGTTSKECSPCIHSSAQQIKELDNFSVARLKHLEEAVGLAIFEGSDRISNGSDLQALQMGAVRLGIVGNNFFRSIKRPGSRIVGHVARSFARPTLKEI